MLTSGLVFGAMASLLVGYMTTAMRPPRASPSRKSHGASRKHYAPVEALAGMKRPALASSFRKSSIWSRKAGTISLLVEDGIVKQVNIEKPGKFGVSNAETMLLQLG